MNLKGNIVFRLVYTSKAIASVTDEDLEDILSKARSNNPRLGLTGLLMFHNSEFFQVLEGREASVEALFKKSPKTLDTSRSNVSTPVKSRRACSVIGVWPMRPFHRMRTVNC